MKHGFGDEITRREVRRIFQRIESSIGGKIDRGNIEERDEWKRLINQALIDAGESEDAEKATSGVRTGEWLNDD